MTAYVSVRATFLRAIRFTGSAGSGTSAPCNGSLGTFRQTGTWNTAGTAIPRLITRSGATERGGRAALRGCAPRIVRTCRRKSFPIRWPGSRFPKVFEFLERGTRPNQLFLTEVVARNVAAPYKSVFEWFATKLTVIFPYTVFNQRESLIRSDAGLRSNYDTYFKAFDLGLVGLQVIETEIEQVLPSLPEQMKNDLRTQLGADKAIQMLAPGTGVRLIITKKENGDLVALRLLTLHEDDRQRKVGFDIQEESDGTQRLVDLIPALVQFQGSDKVFVIDEIDRSLHPTLSRTFFEVFYEKSDRRAQLIATTHDLDLLDLDLLRKDEIWFVEKDKHGASRVYSLEEFKPRFDNDIRKGYLLGRFGGIPVVRKPQGLGW